MHIERNLNCAATKNGESDDAEIVDCGINDGLNLDGNDRGSSGAGKSNARERAQ